MVEVFGVCDRRLRSKVSPIPPLAGLADEMAILIFSHLLRHLVDFLLVALPVFVSQTFLVDLS